MDINFYDQLSRDALDGQLPSPEHCRAILQSDDIDFLSLVYAAYRVRRHFFKNEVTVHIINNAQNGRCREDCHYCAQSKISKALIEDYAIKSDEEILREAEAAYESGAHRYCMVFAGRGPTPKRIDHLCRLIRAIKSRYPIETCVSAGIVDGEGALKLKEAGLDRLNHNLNTSERNYPNICTTHTYNDRINTLRSATAAGLDVCSGVIAGMGETADELVDLALTLRRFNARSIPVNFLVPIEGNPQCQPVDLSPQYCIRILCLFRLTNPDAEVRVAAGREGHLRSLEALSLYPANSLFMDGYLNTKGSRRAKTLRMIKDAGFVIRSDKDLDQLLAHEEPVPGFEVDDSQAYMKDLSQLRPTLYRLDESRAEKNITI